MAKTPRTNDDRVRAAKGARASALKLVPANGAVDDLVTAADVLVYVGALGDLFRLVAARLAPGGLFAFSVEEAADGDLVLRDSLRYAHGEPYVRHALTEAGLTVVGLERATLRHDRGAPIRGLVVVAAPAP